MNLEDAQKKQIAAWIAGGLKLSDIQSRLASELGIRMTYMEVRMLVDDLKLVPRDPEPSKPVELAAKAADKGVSKIPPEPAPTLGGQPKGTPASSGVSVKVDQLARPGAIASGDVTFSDGQTATWYLDELGRLGLVPKQNGYRPPPADVQQFQAALETELSKLGY